MGKQRTDTFSRGQWVLFVFCEGKKKLMENLFEKKMSAAVDEPSLGQLSSLTTPALVDQNSLIAQTWKMRGLKEETWVPQKPSQGAVTGL